MSTEGCVIGSVRIVQARPQDCCGNCLFYLKAADVGLCRRYPAHAVLVGLRQDGEKLLPVVNHMFPSMPELDWCGEYKPIYNLDTADMCGDVERGLAVVENQAEACADTFTLIPKQLPGEASNELSSMPALDGDHRTAVATAPAQSD